MGSKSQRAIAKETGISNFKLGRILSKNSPLYFVDLLTIINTRSPYQILGFLEQIIPLSSIKELNKLAQRRKQIVELIYDEPSLATISSGLLLNLNKNSRQGFLRNLADECGLEEEKAESIVKKLIDLKLADWKGNQIIELEDLSNDDRVRIEGTRRIRKYWLAKAIEIIENQENLEEKEKDAFGSIVFSTSYKTRQKIVSLYINFFEEMKKTVLADEEDPDIIQVLSFQLFNPKHQKTNAGK